MTGITLVVVVVVVVGIVMLVVVVMVLVMVMDTVIAANQIVEILLQAPKCGQVQWIPAVLCRQVGIRPVQYQLFAPGHVATEHETAVQRSLAVYKHIQVGLLVVQNRHHRVVVVRLNHSEKAPSESRLRCPGLVMGVRRLTIRQLGVNVQLLAMVMVVGSP